MATKKLMLKESIKNLGKVGDIVEVSPGYARNFLMPRDLAVEPTANNVKKVEARRKEIEAQEAQLRSKQETIIKKLEGAEVHLERKANEQGHLFGSVGATDISKMLQATGYDVQADDVYLQGKLDQIKDYKVIVKFHEGLEVEIKVWVHADAESKAAIEAHQKAAKTADAAAAAADAASE